MFPSTTTTLLLLFSTLTHASPQPQITPLAQLARRANDPSLVGYISGSNGFSDARSCDYPQTLSTSGNFVQCCPTTGACPFFTSCSANTLLAEGATVPCDVNDALTCNTAVVVPTANANGGGSYLACWQKTLGSAPFTFVQDVGSASVAGAASTSASASRSVSSGTSSAAGRTTSGAVRTSSAASSSSASSSASANAGAGEQSGLNGGLLGGVLALVAQLLL